MSAGSIEVPIKEYVDLAVGHEREIRVALERSNQEALQAAKLVIDSRLSGMNELREQITSERGQYIGREVFDRVIGQFESRLRAVEGFRENINGRIYMIGAFLLLVQVALAWWKSK